MEAILGAPVGVFFGLTVILMGGCGFMMGQSLAQSWKPEWQVYVYSLFLGLADRFLVYALFKGQLWSLSGLIVHTLAILLISLLAFRVSRARRMVQQYPWLYVRTGPLSWREKTGGRAA
jgi:hypothetical protein